MTGDQVAFASRYGLGLIDQIGFVVHDISQALPNYSAMFGHFSRRQVALPLTTTRFMGQPVAAELELGFARNGELEIELVQVTSGQTPHSKYLAEHGEGLHHIRFRVTDLDKHVSLLETDGFVTTFSGGTRRRFAYLTSPLGLKPTEIELIEVEC